MMRPLLTAIYGRFSATPATALYTALSGKLYQDEAPQGTAIPYAVCVIPYGVPQYTFRDTYERATVQFDIYAATNADATDIYGHLTTLYDFCQLSVTGYTFQKFERSHYSKTKEEFCWHVTVQYSAWLEKA